ncbi:MAG: hypothetical protein IPN79_17820 [Saprospiraceae bacterium]|nr:hypothetical protein [Saprospiraceae bacterium]
MDQKHGRTSPAVFRFPPFFKVLQLQTKEPWDWLKMPETLKLPGSLNLSVKKWARLKAEAEFFLSEPSYASQVLVVNNVELFRKNWLKSFGTTFSGTLDIPLTQTSITAVQSYPNQSILAAG